MKWTDHEKAQLIAMLKNGYKLQVIAERLGRSIKSIYGMVEKMKRGTK